MNLQAWLAGNQFRYTFRPPVVRASVQTHFSPTASAEGGRLDVFFCIKRIARKADPIYKEWLHLPFIAFYIRCFILIVVA